MSDTTSMVAPLVLAGGLIVLLTLVLNQTAPGQVYFGGNPGDQSFNVKGAW
jgi:hypothetical protein